jgi:hypothetical protein
LERALNAGLPPRHYQSLNPHQLLQACVGDYLKEKFVAEALERNIPAFSKFFWIVIGPTKSSILDHIQKTKPIKYFTIK